MTCPGPVNRPVLTGSLLLLLVAGGFAIVCLASHEPVGGFPDAIVYMEAAENLLRGDGLVAVERSYEASPLHQFRDKRLTHYPPLFPLIVAAIGACGAVPVDAAKWLNILLMGGTTLMIGYGVYKATAGSTLFSVVAGAFFALSPATLAVHAVALSDPVFVFLGTSGLVLISSYLEQNRRVPLLGAAGLIALAWMTRYVGVALVAAGVLAILIHSKTSLHRRVLDSIVLGVVASLPMAVWLTWNHVAAGTAMNRPISYHPLLSQQLNNGFQAVLSYLLPVEVPRMARFAVTIIAATAILGIIAGMIRRGRGFATWRPPHIPPLCRVMCLFGLAYLVVMAASITFVDAIIQLDSRHLFPLFICLVMAGCSMASAFRASFGRPQLILGCCALFSALAINAYAAGIWAAAGRHGRGPDANSWPNTRTMKWLQSLPPGSPVYTNGGPAVHYWTGRRTFGLPVKFDPMSYKRNVDYQKQMSALRDGLRQPGSALVLFRFYYLAMYYPSEIELRREINLNLVTVLDAPEGKVLRAAQP